MRTVAFLVGVCVIAGSCGSDTNDVSAGEGNGPEYGATLEEWSREIGAERDGAAASDVDVPLTEEYESLEWEDLVAPGFSSQDIAAQYVEELASVEDGSPEAEAIYEEMQNQWDGAAVNDEYDGKNVQLAGFVAPLTYDDDIVTEFLLVPYFGACVHVPPPPSHQTILVTVDKENGLTIDEAWGAVWVAGSLVVEPSTTDLATSSYTITGAFTGVYKDY